MRIVRNSGVRPIRVMQSFRRPRPTSNPYIHMLDTALGETEGMVHLRFDRQGAIFGRYDAIHFHWPETLLGGSTPMKALARRAYALALRIRLTLTPVAVVRTVHNVTLPSDVTPWERRFLRWVERRTDHRIVLNEQTTRRGPTTLILHGHYRDWFASVPRVPATDATLGFVGLVRRYKGVEDLVEAFADTREHAPQLRLLIAGSPTSTEIERAVREGAARDPRIRLDLRYLSENDFAHAVMESAGVVLPYRFMHNSGTALAALSLERPVLVPRNPVTEALSLEVGPGWVTCFDGELSTEALEGFASAISQPPTAPPDLSAREWRDAGRAHRDAYLQAVHDRRGAR